MRKIIIKIAQSEANGKNKFEIKVDNKLKYLAGTPWMNIKVPLNIDDVRHCVITTTDGNICYKTSYDIMENVSNTAIPMKWVVTGEQKGRIFNICDDKNNFVGKFYKLTNGFLDTKYVIEYGQHILKCYDIAVGKTRNILVYKDGFQISEIVKPLTVSNNLDSYYVFLLDEYSELEVIIPFFVVLFDYQNYPNSGQFVIYKKEVEIKYTYDKNNKFYDKHWIENHFSKEETFLIDKKIKKEREDAVNDIKQYGKVIVSLIVIGWLIALGLFWVLYSIYCL